MKRLHVTCSWPRAERSQTWPGTGNTVLLSAEWSPSPPTTSAAQTQQIHFNPVYGPQPVTEPHSWCGVDRRSANSHPEVFSSYQSVAGDGPRRLQVDDSLQALGQPHRTQEVERAQAVAGVGKVQQSSCLDQEVDGWMWWTQDNRDKTEFINRKVVQQQSEVWFLSPSCDGHYHSAGPHSLWCHFLGFVRLVGLAGPQSGTELHPHCPVSVSLPSQLPAESGNFWESGGGGGGGRKMSVIDLGSYNGCWF